MTTSNVNNGTTDTTVNTDNLTSKQYNISSTYLSNNTYQTTTANSLLNINQNRKVVGDCTTDNEWFTRTDNDVITTDKPVVDSNGVHSGTYRFVCWDKIIPQNSKLTISGTYSTNSRINPVCLKPVHANNTAYAWIVLQRDVGDYNIITGNTANSNTTSTIVQAVPTPFTITVEITPENTIITYDNNSYTTIPVLNQDNTVAEEVYYSFRKWGSGEIIITGIEYQPI